MNYTRAPVTIAMNQAHARKWKPITPKELFGGLPKSVARVSNTVIDREAELMQALAEAKEEARLGKGALEESSDEFEGL